MRPMLAVGYLIGVLDLQRIWKSQRREPASMLRDPPAERVDRAVITLGRYGPLSRGDTSSDAPVPELASTEALALIAYFARHSVPTHVVVGSDQAPQALHVLLEEGERARSENRRLDEALHAARERAARAGLALALSGEALIIAFVILFAIVAQPPPVRHLGAADVLRTVGPAHARAPRAARPLRAARPTPPSSSRPGSRRASPRCARTLPAPWQASHRRPRRALLATAPQRRLRTPRRPQRPRRRRMPTTRAPRLPSAQLGRAETARSLRIRSAKLSAPSHQPSGESLARVKTGEVSTSRTAAFLISCGDGPAKACPRGIYVSVCKRCAL
jgi:hypothetical protein